MKKRILGTIAIVFCLSITIASTSVFAEEHHKTFSIYVYPYATEQNSNLIDKEVLSKARNWLVDNYKQFYSLRGINADIIKKEETKDVTRYTVALSCETHYLFNNAMEIPFVKGLIDESSTRELTAVERKQIDNIISSIKEDAFTEEWSELNIDVVIDYDKNENRISGQMYYDDGITNTLYKVGDLSLNYNDLYDQGLQAAKEIMTNNDDMDIITATDTYNGTAARNYSRTYSSNPSTCDIDGSSCTVRQKRSVWNTSQYPYYSLFKHNDCADFVSQALSKGGIPEVSGSAGWYRTKNGANGTWTTSWTVVGNLKNYMVSHSYWVSSSYSSCPAGGTLITDGGDHVVMIDYNDGTTHKFNAHTNDRKKYVFSNKAGYLYYKVRRLVYPTQ